MAAVIVSSGRKLSSVHTTSSYDPLGRQVSTTNPVSGTSITTYNATEQVAAQDAQGNVTRESYDAAGRLIQATDALTGTVGYGYAAAGNTTAITSGDTSGNVIQVETRQYDALNRAIADTVAGPNGASPQTTTTRYDPDGNTYQVNQPTGATTVDTYDLADDLVTSETDGAPVLSATHQNQSTYRYDAAGNGVETADPDGRDTTTTFDGDSRAVSEVSTTPGVTGTTTLTTTSQYDPDGNTLAQTVQTRDPSGNVQTFTNSATFDAADNQTSATDNGLTTAYGYDAAGQQRTETIQNGASTVTTTLDPQGRETALAEGGYTSSFSYNSNDLPLTATLPGGIQEARAYDPNSRLTGLTASGPTQVPATTTLHSAYAYGYDAAGRVNSTTTLSGTDALGYDAQGRLTQECGPQVVIKGGDGCYHYTYDADGNLLTALDDQVGVTDLYTYTNPLQPDQQTQGGATTSPATATIAFGYDGAGNTTSISDPVALADPSSAPYKKDARNDSFGYDALERVVRVTRLESTKVGTDTIVTPFTATIAYNAAGLRSDYLLTPDPRTGKQPVDTRFSYRGGELAQAVVVAVTGTLYTNTFVYRADGTPYELIRSDPTGTARYWYETDGMGSVVALTDVNGKVMDRYGYDSWGEPVIDDRVNEMVPQQLRYRGYYYDEALTYYWVDGRYYDPEAMRWLQPSSPNTHDYAYAADDPADVMLNVTGFGHAATGPMPRDEPQPGGDGGAIGDESFDPDPVALLPEYATEADVQALMADTNKFFARQYQLTRPNAIRALTGPPGTTSVKVAGVNGQGADIRFYRNEELLMRREIKALASEKQFQKRLSEGAGQAEYGQGARDGLEVWIQVRANPEFDLPTLNKERQFWFNRLRGFQMDPNRRNLAQFSRVRVTVIDTRSQRLLNNARVVP